MTSKLLVGACGRAIDAPLGRRPGGRKQIGQIGPRWPVVRLYSRGEDWNV